MTDIRYTAACVPDDAEHRPWEVAFALAADWIEAQSGQPLLITPVRRQVRAMLDRFPTSERGHTVATARPVRR